MLDAIRQERWRTVGPLLDAALDLDPASRAGFLDTACDRNPELRAELQRLLASCELAERLLESPAVVAYPALLAIPEPAPPAIGARIGPWRIVGEAGRGGMAVVYLAERADEQYRQQVALKVIRGGIAFDPHLARRFLEERQILASLDHPHIARLLDGGVTDDGVPWFAMEYVQGEPIDRYCDARRLTIEQRLRLFLGVCSAVQYAHRNLVVHRDLKPSNILVTSAGEVKLLDFGIAKLLVPGEGGSALTRTGLRLLTPEYASPEQVRGQAVSTASDVYSLGVVLYELLSGRRPYRLAGRPTIDVEHMVLEQAPEWPSAGAITDEAAAARGTSRERLCRQLRGDLDTIVLAALRKEPERRYAGAEQLAADLRRHLEGLPVTARPDTLGYRARKFTRRHPTGIAAAAAFVLLLVGATLWTSVESARTARQRDKAERLSGFLIGLLGAPDPAEGRGEAVTVRELLDSAVPRLHRELGEEPEVRADLLSVMGRAYGSLGLLHRARPLFDSAVAIRRRAGGEELALVRDQTSLAFYLRMEGDQAAAESLYRASLATARRRFGERHPNVTLPLVELGNMLRQHGRLVEAESLLREAVTIQRTQPPDSVLSLAEAVVMLALLLEARGELAEAEALLREAIALRSDTLGTEHPLTGALYVILGRVLHQRRDSSAERFLRRGIELKPLGVRPIDMMYLVRVLADRGELAPAESLARQALAIVREQESEGWSTAEVLVGLGRVRLERGDPAGAEPLLRDGLTMAEKFWPPASPRTTEAKRMLAAALAAQGRPAAAEPGRPDRP